MPRVNRASRIPPSILVLLVCLALALVLTWPMVLHIGSHVPGDGIDDPSLAWNLWWAKYALVAQPQNPFDVRWQFWPVGVNLAFYTLTLLNGALSIPLQAAFGPILAYNALLVASFGLGGLGAYLLSLDVLRASFGAAVARSCGGRTAALFGGLLFAFAAPRLFYAALGQGNIASAQWIPFAALYLMRAARPRGNARDGALAALFMVFQAYAELTYASFLILFAGLAVAWGAWLKFRSHSAAHWLALVGRFALVGALFLVGIAPMLANMLPDLRAEGGLLVSGGGFADLFSADLAGYLFPTQLHPVFGDVIRAVANDSAPRADGSHMPVNKGQQIYVGYVAPVLAALALVQAKRRGAGGFPQGEGEREALRNPVERGEVWFWALSSLVFFVLTLGPSLRVLGHDLGLPLPFALVARLPFFEGNRYPSRYGVMLLAGLAPLTAAGLWSLGAKRPTSGAPLLASRIAPVRRSGRALLASLLIALLLFEHLSIPLPLNDLRVPALYAQVAREAGDFALLELPPGWRNGARVVGKQDIVIMQQLWSQSAHGKRLLGGNTSRNPEFKFQYFSEDPMLSRLIAQTNAVDVPQHDALRATLAAMPVSEADREQARRLAAFLNIRFVMAHRDKMPAETLALARDLLPLELVSEDGPLALYRVVGESPKPLHFIVGADSGRMALAEGWSPSAAAAQSSEPGAVIAQRNETRLLLPLPGEAARIRLRMGALAPEQTVRLIVDGEDAGIQPVSETPGWVDFDIPARGGRPPLSDVRLRFSATQVLPDLAQTLSRPAPAALLVRSAGQETGDFAHIYVNGIDVSPGSRGYNLVALDQLSGSSQGAAAFDTHADPKAGAALAAWIDALPAGTVVAGAARDEASMSLSGEAIAALRSIGVQGDLRDKFRWGHAFIGAKGAAPGAAMEAMDGIRPVQVSLGLPASGPQVAAQLWEILIEPQ